MNKAQEPSKDPKMEIITQITEMSRLLGMMPTDDTIPIREPLTQKEMPLSDWLGATRTSLFKLSLLISKELDIQLQ